MPGISGMQNKNGMSGFLFAQRCRKGTGMSPEFCIGGTGKEHVILPLCGRQGANRISQNAKIWFAKTSNEVSSRLGSHGDR